MTFQLTSDLHLEFYSDKYNRIPKYKKPKYLSNMIKSFLTISAENLILAGDIGYPNSQIYEDFLTYISQKFVRVFIINGNHEYYITGVGTGIGIETVDTLVKSITDKYSNVWFLNNDIFELNTWTIIGTTLWTHISTEQSTLAETYISDYTKIGLTTHETNNLNQRSLDFLSSEIPKAIEKGNNIIVITHHLPVHELIPEKYRDSILNFAFANSLDQQLEEWSEGDKKHIWVSGHSHGHKQILYKGWQLLLNANGYPAENKDYQPNLIIE